MGGDRLARLTIKGGAAVCFGVALFDLVNFRHHTQSVSAVLSYYVLPLGAGAVCLAALRLPASWQQTVSITGVAFVVSLYAAELYLAFVATGVDRFPGAPPPRDLRTKAEVIQDLRRKGVDALPYINALHIYFRNASGAIVSPLSVDGRELWPLGSISNATLVVCREGAEYLAYRSDEHGFNNPPGLWRSPVRVAAVGDSFTHGECIDREKSFMGLIRDRYPATLNLGASGTGPLSHLAAIREFLPALRPAVVLWVFFDGNDIGDMENEAASPLLVRYLERDFTQGLRARQPAIDRGLRQHADAAFNAQLRREAERQRQRWINVLKLHRVRLVLRISRDRQPLPSDSSFQRFRSVLDAARQTVASWRGRLVFVYLPSWTRYHSALRRGYEEETKQRVLDIARQLRLPVIDIDSALVEAAADPLTFYQGHFNEAGNALVARSIMAQLATMDHERGQN